MNASDLNMPPQVAPTNDRGGQWVEIGGAQYKVPPLNFKALREHMDAINKLSALRGASTVSPEHFGSITKVVHAALVRNYPAMTIEEVEDMVDMANMVDVLNAVMAVSGLTKGEDKPGEGKAAP